MKPILKKVLYLAAAISSFGVVTGCRTSAQPLRDDVMNRSNAILNKEMEGTSSVSQHITERGESIYIHNQYKTPNQCIVRESMNVRKNGDFDYRKDYGTRVEQPAPVIAPVQENKTELPRVSKIVVEQPVVVQEYRPFVPYVPGVGSPQPQEMFLGKVITLPRANNFRVQAWVLSDREYQ